MTRPLPPAAARLVDEVARAVGGGAWEDRPVTVDGGTGLAGPLAVPELALGAVAAQLIAARSSAETPRGALRLDAGHVGAAFASERHVRFHGKHVGPGFAPLSRFWPTADGWLRLHGNYPWHRAAAQAVLGDDVPAAAREWPAEELETAVVAAGGAAAAVRSAAGWAAHPQAVAVAGLPLLGVDRPVAGPARPVTPAGLRVLDLTRVIAGPVATRALAAQGADVLRVDGPRRPDHPGGLLDTGAGKRHVVLDLARRHDRRLVEELLPQADVVVQSYRQGALDAFGLDPAALIERHRHLVVVRLSAWGLVGPWRQRRGFDSLVQAATGIADRYGDFRAPGALPVQALDHATGYLAAAVALGLLGRVRDEGGGWTGELSLAQTAHWLLGSGDAGGEPDAAAVDPAPYLVDLPAAGGPVTVVGPPGAPPWPTAARLPPDTRPVWC
ncbi:CoA transferase [Blastococcus saxobsidens]|uniref:Putative CoA-transferase n=1 Tax=Blastococcus saxobsidens (strain DD2) TaxID=1146883 RepID=H6RVX2_BLASD|nr:CoA transferase [Blastococcus saxobsidens]CCG05802.1 putative CoA-transferase [Blastococcus saxobsidens DD2]